MVKTQGDFTVAVQASKQSPPKDGISSVKIEDVSILFFKLRCIVTACFSVFPPLDVSTPLRQAHPTHHNKVIILPRVPMADINEAGEILRWRYKKQGHTEWNENTGDKRILPLSSTLLTTYHSRDYGGMVAQKVS